MQEVSEQHTSFHKTRGEHLSQACKYHKTTAGTTQGSHTHGKKGEWSIKSSAGIVKRFISGRWQDPLASDLENMSTVQNRQRLQSGTT